MAIKKGTGIKGGTEGGPHAVRRKDPTGPKLNLESGALWISGVGLTEKHQTSGKSLG